MQETKIDCVRVATKGRNGPKSMYRMHFWLTNREKLTDIVCEEVGETARLAH